MMGTRLKPSPHTCFLGNFFDLALHNSIMRKWKILPMNNICLTNANDMVQYSVLYV